MSKLSYEDKINIYMNLKLVIALFDLLKQYKIDTSVIKYLVRLIDKHEYDILRTNKNKYYPHYQKRPNY